MASRSITCCMMLSVPAKVTAVASGDRTCSPSVYRMSVGSNCFHVWAFTWGARRRCEASRTITWNVSGSSVKGNSDPYILRAVAPHNGCVICASLHWRMVRARTSLSCACVRVIFMIDEPRRLFHHAQARACVVVGRSNHLGGCGKNRMDVYQPTPCADIARLPRCMESHIGQITTPVFSCVRSAGHQWGRKKGISHLCALSYRMGGN